MAREWYCLTLITVALRRNHVSFWILITNPPIICSIDNPVDTLMPPSLVSKTDITKSCQEFASNWVGIYQKILNVSYGSMICKSLNEVEVCQLCWLFCLTLNENYRWYIIHVIFVKEKVWHKNDTILQPFVRHCELLERYDTHPASVLFPCHWKEGQLLMPFHYDKTGPYGSSLAQ